MCGLEIIFVCIAIVALVWLLGKVDGEGMDKSKRKKRRGQSWPQIWFSQNPALGRLLGLGVVLVSAGGLFWYVSQTTVGSNPPYAVQSATPSNNSNWTGVNFTFVLSSNATNYTASLAGFPWLFRNTTRNYRTSKNPVSRVDMDEESGTTLADSGYGTQLGLNRNWTINTTSQVAFLKYPYCLTGSCINFTDVNGGYIEGIRNETVVEFSNITFCAAVNFNSLNATNSTSPRSLSSLAGACSISYNLNAGGTSTQVQVQCNNASNSFSTAVSGQFRQGQWVHSCGVFNGTDLVLYVNGTYASQTSLTGPLVSGSLAQPLIGDTSGFNRHIYAAVDSVLIDNVSYTPAEIAQVYGGFQNISTLAITSNLSLSLPPGQYGYYAVAESNAGNFTYTTPGLLTVNPAPILQTTNGTVGNISNAQTISLLTYVNFTLGAEASTGYLITVNGSTIQNVTSGNFSNYTTYSGIATARTFLWCVRPSGYAGSNYTGTCWTQNVYNMTPAYRQPSTFNVTSGIINALSEPAGQAFASNTSIINVTNNGLTTMNFSMRVNSTTNSNYTLCVSTTNTSTGCTSLTTSYQKIYTNLAAGNAYKLWLFVNFTNITGPLSNVKEQSILVIGRVAQ